MSITRRVTLHLAALGLRHAEAAAFAAEVETWIARSGPEWTVERLKGLKQSMVQMLATGDHYVVPPGWASRVNRKGQVCFKHKLVHFVFCAAKDNLRLAENFTRTYQAIKLDNVSRSQRQKMEKAITSPSNAKAGFVDECVKRIRLRHISSNAVRRASRAARSAPTLMTMAASAKRSPAIDIKGSEIRVTRTRVRETMRPEDIWTLLFRDRQTKVLWKQYPADISRAVLGTGLPYIDEMEEEVELPAGTLTALQEGGCKVRWIANPHLLYQAFGEPLKVKLQEVSRAVFPEIRVHDQDSGRSDVVRWLQEGKTVYCYDCSSFTDRFPLALQEEILQQLWKRGVITDFDVAAFKLVTSKGWYFRGSGSELKWSVGQPLGYGPSFALATLTHAALLSSLCGDGDWRVVGDDVVIADPCIAEKYQSIMIDLGVEINRSKSVISSRLGEFLGKLITSNGVNPSIKVKPLGDTNRTLRLLDFYGPQFKELLGNDEWKAQLTSILPRWLGGLDQRPEHMTEKDVLDLLDHKRIQHMLLKDEIEVFHRTVPWSPQDVADWMKLKQKLLEPIHEILGSLAIQEIEHHFGDGVRVDELNALSAPSITTTSSPPFSANTFRALSDKRWFLNQEPIPIKSDDYPYVLNTHGFIHHAEKPSTLDSVSHVSLKLTTGENAYESIQNCSGFHYFRKPKHCFDLTKRK